MTLSRRPPFSSFAAGRQQKKNKSPAICHQQKRRRRRRLECLIASISLLANPQLPSNRFAIPIKKENKTKQKKMQICSFFYYYFYQLKRRWCTTIHCGHISLSMSRQRRRRRHYPRNGELKSAILTLNFSLFFYTKETLLV